MDNISVPAEFMDRELPHSEEAERAVIGSALTDPASVALSAELIKPDDFYFPQNRAIYRAIMELFNEDEAIDFVTVSNRLNQEDKLDAVGGPSYLSNLAMSVPTSQHVTYYSQIVHDKALLRRLINTGSAVCALAFAEEGGVDKILEQSEQLIFDAADSGERREIVRIDDILMSSYAELIENFQSEGGLTGIDTGFTELNRRTGGFHGGELILIAGRPGMGKSSFAVNIAEYAAIKKNIPVAIFNLEMPRNQIVNRILCSQALVDSSKIRTGEFDAEDWISLSEHLNTVANAPIYIDDSADITVSEIRAKCRRLKQAKNLGLIVIDYLQLMQSSGKNESRQYEIAEISRSLKILAKELDLPVIALSQLSRASESRSDKRPILSDLRESGAIEQDADMVMFLYRDEYYNKDSEDKGLAECNIAKHRSGEIGMFKLGWQGKFTKFTNVEYVLREEEK